MTIDDKPEPTSGEATVERVSFDYEAPVVSDHGSIQDLTLGGMGFGSDGLGSVPGSGGS